MSDASKIDDGGAAYPVLDSSGGGVLYCQDAGLTKRDYFAAAALTGFTAGAFWAEVDNDEAARAAYAVADAMIAASKTGGPEHG